MVLNNSHPELAIPDVDFYTYNVNKLKSRGNEIAMVDVASDRQLTYLNIYDASFKLASALSKRGLKKQDIVAICASNCIEYSLIILGIAACGAITTTCNPRSTKMEIQKQLENCQPVFVITDSDHLNKVTEVAKDVLSVKEVISINDSDSKHCTNLWPMIDADDGTAFPSHVNFNTKEDVVLLPYSSGTTGLPKGVMLTHRNMVAVMHGVSAVIKPLPNSVTYSFIPLFHIYGLNQLFTSFDGVTLVVDKRFNLQRLFEGIEKYKVTSFNGVPTTLVDLLNSSQAQNYDLSSLRAITVGGSPLSENLVTNTMKKMHIVLAHGWGMTETAGACAGGLLLNVPMDTVGPLIPNAKLKVVDPETREELGENQDGELLFSSPGVMKGYYKNPAANNLVFENGWLCTGDIGHYDSNGLIYITDRMKELIKYKGFQIAPAELESLLLEHPKIRDVGVVGVPDELAGEVPRAFVVKEDDSLTAKEIELFVDSKVSSYKSLRGGVYFLNEIPRTALGKILRRRLAQLSTSSSKTMVHGGHILYLLH